MVCGRKPCGVVAGGLDWHSLDHVMWQEADYLGEDFGPDEQGQWPHIDPEPYPIRPLDDADTLQWTARDCGLQVNCVPYPVRPLDHSQWTARDCCLQLNCVTLSRSPS